MVKALIAFVVTIFLGCFAIDLLSGYREFGPILATAVMGAFIIYFNEKKK